MTPMTSRCTGEKAPGKGLGPQLGFPSCGPKPREAPPATRGPMHPRRRILLRQNDRPGLPMTRCYLRSAICRRAPQPSRPSLSGGAHYVTPPPCEDEGQNPGKNLGNSRSGRFGDSSIFPDGTDAHYRSEIMRRHGGQIDVMTSEKVGRNIECSGNRAQFIGSNPLTETSRHEVADLVHGAGLGILHLVDAGQGVGIGAHHDPVL